MEEVIQEPEIQKTMRELLEWTDNRLTQPDVPSWVRGDYIQLKQTLETILERLSAPIIVMDLPYRSTQEG